MDHYVIKKDNMVCHVDDKGELKCDNKYDYNDDTGAKFSIHSSGPADAQFCIQSKQNNMYANTTTAGVVVFDKDRCSQSDKFKINFLDVFDVTKFTLGKDGNVCNGTNGASIDCNAANVSENNTFTLLQETKPYCPTASASIGDTFSDTVGSWGSYLSGSNAETTNGNSESMSSSGWALFGFSNSDPTDPEETGTNAEATYSSWSNIAYSLVRGDAGTDGTGTDGTGTWSNSLSSWLWSDAGTEGTGTGMSS